MNGLRSGQRRWLPAGSQALCLVVLLLAATNACAFEIDHWRLQTSVLTRHFHPDPSHNEHQHLVDLELWRADNWHYGASFFYNSYNQPCEYVYAGKAWDLGDPGGWYARITFGLMHGYTGEYKDHIPLNGLGTAPVYVPSLGFRYRAVFGEFQLLGLAGGMITMGVRFGGRSGQ